MAEELSNIAQFSSKYVSFTKPPPLALFHRLVVCLSFFFSFSPFFFFLPLSQFASDNSSCIVRLGKTMAMASVSASLEAPYADRHSEGSITFDVLHTAMAGFGADFQRKNEDAIELSRLVERGLRESRAVDLEALCVQPGRKVWHLQVDVRVLDNCGNSTDAVGLAALGALCVFRRPDVTVDPDAHGGIVIHSPADKEPLPLTLHHLPLPISFAFFDGGEVIALDPVSKEEAAAAGSFTVTVNPQGELCAAQKAHGVGISHDAVMQCMRIAAEQVKGLTAQLRKAVEVHEVAQMGARVRRHHPGSGGGGIDVDVAGDINVTEVGTLALPEDVKQGVEHAEAQDNSEGDGEDEEEESEGDGEEMEIEQDGDDDDDEQEEEEGASAKESGKKLSTSSSSPKRRRKSQQQQQQGDGDDPYAAIAEMIVKTKPSESGDADDDDADDDDDESRPPARPINNRGRGGPRPKRSKMTAPRSYQRR